MTATAHATAWVILALALLFGLLGAYPVTLFLAIAGGRSRRPRPLGGRARRPPAKSRAPGAEGPAVSDLSQAVTQSIEANGLRLSQPGCIQRPDQAVLALCDSLEARGVGIVADIDAAIAALLEVLPDGWAWSVTNVPGTGEWGCSASRTGPDVTPADVVQTGTARSMAAAIRAMVMLLRNRGSAAVWP